MVNIQSWIFFLKTDFVDKRIKNKIGFFQIDLR